MLNKIINKQVLLWKSLTKGQLMMSLITIALYFVLYI